VTLKQLTDLFLELGAKVLYAKLLSENDNTKQQIYLGPDFKALNILPNQGVLSDERTGKSNFKAKLKFAWITDEGSVYPAPNAQLILYPKYPEVRLSGFLLGCKCAPSKLMTAVPRLSGRVLFLGVTSEDQILGYVAAGESSLAKEFRAENRPLSVGVFSTVPLTPVDDEEIKRQKLLDELKRIHTQGWIASKRLNSVGEILRCLAPNCGGLTLEAELGIRPNSKAEPDFLGWEIKQHKVASFSGYNSGVITLMTPEPTGGLYHDKGPDLFIRKYGYADMSGIVDRMNFGGIHRASERHPTTGLTLTLIGYDYESGKIVGNNGGIALLDGNQDVAAIWDFTGLIKHWSKKHKQAAYVPARTRKEPELQYFYGDRIRLAVGTDFLLFLKSMALGKVYYDPGLKLVNASSTAEVKRRNQFRIKSADIPSLYSRVDLVQL
jgi:MvaI/BcnI restriction endonuclease family